MSRPVFAPSPAPSVDGSSLRHTRARKEIQFGEGRAQRRDDGINPVKRRARLTWALATAAEAATIVNFLIANSTTGFLWTWPGDTQRAWIVVGGVEETPLPGGRERLAVEIEETV